MGEQHGVGETPSLHLQIMKKTAEKLGIDWDEIRPIIDEIENELSVKGAINEAVQALDFYDTVAESFSKHEGPITKTVKDRVTAQLIAKTGMKVAKALEDDSLSEQRLERLALKLGLPIAIAKAMEKAFGTDGENSKYVELLVQRIDQLMKENEELKQKLAELEQKLIEKRRQEELEALRKEIDDKMKRLEELVAKLAEAKTATKTGGESGQQSAFDILLQAKKVEAEIREILSNLGYKVEPVTEHAKLEEAVKKAYELGKKKALEETGIEAQKIKLVEKLIDRAIDFVSSLFRQAEQQRPRPVIIEQQSPERLPSVQVNTEELRKQLEQEVKKVEEGLAESSGEGGAVATAPGT